MRQYLLLFLLLFAGSLPAQVRVAKLVIKPNEVFMLAESDILVADTLIMMDSSTLVLNKLKTENFLRVKVARFGSHCTIDGSGIDGKPGRNGIPGITPIGPCINGSAGKDGTRGLDGTKGLNLFMYLEKVTIAGQLTVDLSGGRGGQGVTVVTVVVVVPVHYIALVVMVEMVVLPVRVEMAEMVAY